MPPMLRDAPDWLGGACSARALWLRAKPAHVHAHGREARRADLAGAGREDAARQGSCGLGHESQTGGYGGLAGR